LALAIGVSLGSHEIVSLLGVGGMGEVYLARDTKLGRRVAIKVLPDAVAADPDRIAMFEREAKVLASLNHHNIAALFGMEQAEGRHFLIMELVEGQTLAGIIAAAPPDGLPLSVVLPVAMQLAGALEAAHERGIVHRDLKPANVKVTPGDMVKVLDFGLAKAFSTDGLSGDVFDRQTLTATRLAPGTIAGTPAYMSPEQARGQAVDNRADIWAFGCVLYEMLTGRMAFSGATVSDTMASVLERSPDWSALPAATPPNLRRVLSRCLEKQPKSRWRDIGDVRIELEDSREWALPPVAAERRGHSLRERAAWAALVVVAAATAAVLTPLRTAPEAREARVDLLFPREVATDFAQIALSPDGQQVVTAFSFNALQRESLWLRSLESTSGRILAGTEGATFPFWSPDGESIGFFAEGKLKRIDVSSQAIAIVADAPLARGGAWQPDDMILFAPNASGPLSRVNARGGTPEIATHLETGQNDHRAPVILPDGRHFLYYARGTPQARGVYVARLDGSDFRRLLDAEAAAVYAKPGHLLFARNGELLAQPFDTARLTLSGEAFRVAARVAVNPGISLASLSASASGSIAYSTASVHPTQLTWVDRAGNRLEAVGTPDQSSLANPELSPDGKRVAISRVVGGNWDIWLLDMPGTMSRFTSDVSFDFNPIWSPDGRRILFQSNNSTINSRAVDDGGPGQVVLKGAPAMVYPTDISADGQVLLYTRGTATSADLWYLSLGDQSPPKPFVETEAQERDGQFSPDGRWVAYQSNESGRFEIYMRPFPGPGNRIQVSSGGGQQVRWGANGRELFYIATDRRLVSVPLAPGAYGTASIGRPVPLFRIEFDNNPQARQQYVVSNDGLRFLVNAATEVTDAPSITLISNWKGTRNDGNR
jgi:Tol biopolymer transport system component